jgi:hypothetical protein
MYRAVVVRENEAVSNRAMDPGYWLRDGSLIELDLAAFDELAFTLCSFIVPGLATENEN